MTALAADRPTPRRSGQDLSLPVAASTKIYAGALVCVNASGYATKGAVSTTLKAVGVAQEQVDNSAGANGDLRINVRRGVFLMGNSSAGDLIALADVGSTCYIVDDQTVAKTNGTSTRSAAGVVRDVDASGVWVEF
jgi:hypothetical protein